jgi:histidyl-tRNA synthetase
MKNKTDLPQTLKGFRDFLPNEKKKREYIKQKIVNVFERYGFLPLETPTLEYASLLLGKYGNEADKLVYTFTDRGERSVGLRYDQTVPTARVLGQYQNELPKYFRRYQIQNVFRADKPQKGRYREFTQCDCDVFGATSSIADAEILAVYTAVFLEIGFRSLVIQLNDRQTLMQTLSPFAKAQVDIFSLIQSIDKLDKLSTDAVTDELCAKGLDRTAAQACLAAVQSAQASPQLLDVLEQAVSLGVPREMLVVNPTLARGLDYYTGMIFEGKIMDYDVGSVGGGGRYDRLIEQLSGYAMPAVGFGIGFDRTVEAADQLGLISNESTTSSVLVGAIETVGVPLALRVAAILRKESTQNVEVCPEVQQIGKLLKLADQRQVTTTVIVGSAENDAQQVLVKDMRTGEQEQVELAQLLGRMQR